MHFKSRRLILAILFILCLSFQASAWNPMIVTSGGTACADCASDNADFIWECNSVTVGDTGFSPCGCSDGDTSMTGDGSDEEITGGAVKSFDDTSDGWDAYYAGFDVADDIWDQSLHTIFIKFKITTWADGAALFLGYGSSAENKVTITMTPEGGGTTNNLAGTHAGETGGATSVAVQLTGDNVDPGTVFIVRYRCQTGVGGVDHGIALFDTDSIEVEAEILEDDDPHDFDEASTTIGIGQPSAITDADLEIYYIHIYNEWRTTDPNA